MQYRTEEEMTDEWKPLPRRETIQIYLKMVVLTTPWIFGIYKLIEWMRT
jgi:hypothetical protein